MSARLWPKKFVRASSVRVPFRDGGVQREKAATQVQSMQRTQACCATDKAADVGEERPLQSVNSQNQHKEGSRAKNEQGRGQPRIHTYMSAGPG